MNLEDVCTIIDSAKNYAYKSHYKEIICKNF